MKIKAIGCSELKRSLKAGYDYIALNAGILDNLNVFPVPDGDTGINMYSTLKSGIEAIIHNGCSSIADVFNLLNEHATNDSRGNSGFILARFFKGFALVVGENEVITGSSLSQGFENGSYLAKSSLLTPVEGTMITIIFNMAESMAGLLSDNILDYFIHALKSAREKIFETPKLLPVLAKAGVVDSGGLGFIFLIEGMLRGLIDEEIILEQETDYRFKPDPSIQDNTLKRLSFRFCTELTVEKNKNKKDKEIALNNFRALLEENGDSIGLINEEKIMKLHIHTNVPQKIVKETEEYGTIIKLKIDDMSEQLNLNFRVMQEHEELSILSIIPGSGFKRIFEDLEAAGFLEYSVNLPSSGEILEAIEQVEGDNIIILPNDKNILPAAKLAKERSKKNIYVLPTENVVQGITALYNFSEADSSQQNIKNMSEGMELGICLEVYKSVKDTLYGKTSIKKNDYFVVRGNELLSTDTCLIKSVSRAIRRFDLSEKTSISLFYSDEVNPALLTELEENIKKVNALIEVESIYGGQRNCFFIISIE